MYIAKSPIIKSRNYVPDPIAKYGIPKYADTRLNPKVKDTLDWQKFWEEQLYYIHNGYETGGLWIPGRYYYYLNYRIFNTVMGPIRPQKVDLHLDLAYLIEHCKTNGRNSIIPKGRRVGLSEAGHTMIADYGWRFMEGYKVGVAAGLDIYVQDFMQKWEDANAMVVPEFKTKTLINNSGEVIAGYEYKDEEGNLIEGGTKNIIYKRTMFNNANLFKGLYLNDVIAEEMGEFNHANEFYTATLACLMFGDKQIGSMFMYGTGNKMGVSSEAFKHMWHNPESYNAERLFVPSTMFYFPYYGGATKGLELVEKVPNLLHLEAHQRIGIPDIKAAEDAIKAERKRLLELGDLDTYNEYVQNFAIDIKEVFKKTVSSNFDVDILNNQAFLIESETKKRYGKYKLEWKKKQDGQYVMPREVVATLASDEDNDADCVLILHDGHPVKGYRNLFVGGADSYDQDKSKTSKSLGAMVVRRKTTSIAGFKSKQVVCLVRTRPKRKEIFWETCAKVSVYYGLYQNTLIDVAKPGIFKHYTDAGLDSYLAVRPKKFESINSKQEHEFGVSINSYSKPMMVSLLQSYFLDYTQDLWFLNIIEEALIYDEYEKDSDNDTIDALGISLMQEISNDIPPFKSDDKELEDAFSYPEFIEDADGDIVDVSNKKKQKTVWEGDIKMGYDYSNQIEEPDWED